MADGDQKISHDAYGIAEEILNAIPMDHSKRGELARSLQSRLVSFAMAILEQAGKQVDDSGK